MKTTNYYNTFIEIAEDSPAASATPPPEKGDRRTIANMQFDLIDAQPYKLTSDDVLFQVHADRQDIPEAERESARAAYFSKGQACLRTSPLAKRYGWGIHHDADGKVALVAMGTPEYRSLASDPNIEHVRAMRSKRS